MFRIAVENILDDQCDVRVNVGEFSEANWMTLRYWSLDDYRKSWKMACERLIQRHNAAFVTCMMPPSEADYLVWWPAYPLDSETVAVQHHLLMFSQRPEPFDESRLWEFVRPRQVINEDGETVSEWTCTFNEVRTFLEELKG